MFTQELGIVAVVKLAATQETNVPFTGLLKEEAENQLEDLAFGKVIL